MVGCHSGYDYESRTGSRPRFFLPPQVEDPGLRITEDAFEGGGSHKAREGEKITQAAAGFHV